MHLKTTNATYRRATKARPIKVHFPVPKRAISTLRALAMGRDPRLVNLGVLAVQISDDESIVVGIELEKTKRKPLAVTDNNENSARMISKSPIGVSFEALSRKLETSPASRFNNQFITTPQQRDSLSSRLITPSQNKSVKRKAKRNSSTDGIRGKTIKKLDKQMPTSKGTSTWEMLYSHKGLHCDSWRINRSIPPQVEPIAASQALGVANVPMAQPTLLRENVTKEITRKRETPSVSSPPKGSTIGIYSEDDSSVSSSPCSHSPMNEEELFNLFVDQNFSATSILRQLAEGRHKEDAPENRTEPNESKSSSEQSMHETTKKTLVYGENIGNGQCSLNTAEVSAVGASTVCCEESVNTTISNAYTPDSISNSLSWSTSSTKRSNNEDGSSSISWLNLFENSVKRQRRTFTDLESKKAATDLTRKTVRQDKQKAPKKKSQEASTTHSTTIVPNETALRNFQEYGYYYSSEDLKALGASKSIKISSKSKAESAHQNRSSLNTSKVPQTNNSTNIISQAKALDTNITDSVTDKAPTPESILKQPPKDESDKTEEDCNVMSSAESVLPNSISQVTSLVTSSMSTSSSTSSNNTSETSTASAESSTSMTNTTVGACSSSSTSPTSVTSNITKTWSTSVSSMSAANTMKETCAKSSTSALSIVNTSLETSASLPTSTTLATTSLSTSVTTSSLTTSTTSVTNPSSDTYSSMLTSTTKVTTPTTETCATTSTSSISSVDTSAENVSNSDTASLRRSGQYYALSYVYPMGTVWYPYVAITPYAVGGFNQQKDGNDHSTTEGISSSQYIDLASSMRYWQQLSLLYKNKLLASTPSVPSVFVNTDDNNTMNSGPATNNANLVSSEQSSTDTITSCVSPSSQNTTLDTSSTENTWSTSMISTDSKPTRRASVIVANNEYGKEERPSASTPESMESTESIGSENSKSDVSSCVIDNCNRLIEEHCNRMSEVFAEVSRDGNLERSESSDTPIVPSLSFIPDSSIAYVNIRNTQGTKKSGTNSKDTKGKTKKKKQNKNI